MGRAPCCAKVGLHRGAWSDDEDRLLTGYIQAHGEGQWRSLPSKAGLLRCGKSCRLRWMNYLRPGIKRGNFTADENAAIIRLHSVHGNRWSFIATELPGRTDNEIKNHWNSHLRRTSDVAPPPAAKKPRKKRKTAEKTTKVKADEMADSPEVKADEKAEQPVSSSSSSEKNDGGVASGASCSSGCTGEIDLFEMDFCWPNWMPMEDTAADVDGGYQDRDLAMDGCDLFMSKEDENLMLEKLYHEYLHLLEDDGDGVK